MNNPLRQKMQAYYKRILRGQDWQQFFEKYGFSEPYYPSIVGDPILFDHYFASSNTNKS